MAKFSEGVERAAQQLPGAPVDLQKIVLDVTAAREMANNAKRSSAKSSAPEPASRSLLTKALTAEFEWKDKDDFLDVIYWMRQILGVLLGLIWGLLPLKGIFGIALFLLVNVAIVYVYTSSFQKVDEEEYGGMGEILKEGLMTSFSSFLVSWIILYSSLHSEAL